MWMWLSTICVVPGPTSNVSPCCLSPRSHHIYLFIYYFQGTHINTHHFIVHCRSEHNLVELVLSYHLVKLGLGGKGLLSADPSLLDPFPPFLRQGLLLFIAEHTRLLSLEASRDTPVSSTHLDSGALELEKGLAQAQLYESMLGLSKLRSSTGTASTLPISCTATLQLMKEKYPVFFKSVCVRAHYIIVL